MPLTLSELQDIQAEAMADDVDINLDQMSLWTADQAREFFESGGAQEPPPPVEVYTAPFTRGDKPTGTTPWLACLEKKPSATRRIICFSWTGNRGGQGSAHNMCASCYASDIMSRSHLGRFPLKLVPHALHQPPWFDSHVHFLAINTVVARL